MIVNWSSKRFLLAISEFRKMQHFVVVSFALVHARICRMKPVVEHKYFFFQLLPLPPYLACPHVCGRFHSQRNLEKKKAFIKKTKSTCVSSKVSVLPREWFR